MNYLSVKKAQLTHFFQRYYFESIHAIKAAIAIMIAYTLYLIVPHQLSVQWIFITIIVVMSSHSALGAQVSKSLIRMWATLAGGAMAVIAILTPYHSITLPIYLIITTTTFVFIAVSYGKYSYMGSLGAITFCMITLSPLSSLALAGERTLEILIGIVISLLVSRFIIPIRSIKLIKQRCFLNLMKITELYQKVLIEDRNRFQEARIIQLESKILESHNTQRLLQASIKYEKKTDRLKIENINLIIRIQTALYRYFSVLEVCNRIMTEKLTNDDSCLILMKNFVHALVEFLSDFVKTYPQLSHQYIKEMQERSDQLQTYIQTKIIDQTLLSPLHTLYFISTRIIRVCQQLIEYIHITSEKDNS